MKKLLLFAPAGLLASAGLAWLGYYATDTTGRVGTPTPINTTTTFSQSESNLRQILRHGDERSLTLLNSSIDSLEQQLKPYQEKHLSTEKLESLLANYEKDTQVLSKEIKPHLGKLNQYDNLVSTQTKTFDNSLEQIGLFELKTSAKNLDKLYKNFAKNPSEETKQSYIAESDKIKTIITELYLDGSIEKPLLDYIDNHRNYFLSTDDSYKSIGYERINRIRDTSYAIRTELQMLPTL